MYLFKLKLNIRHYLLVFSILFIGSYPSYAQEVKSIKLERKPSEMDYAPHIAGVFDGEISTLKICDIRGLQTRIGYEIMSYKINYCGLKKDALHISGNQIPDSICLLIQWLCLGEEIYFTDIKAIDEDGKIHTLTNLRLIAIKEDE